jgi:hypothetical protein
MAPTAKQRVLKACWLQERMDQPPHCTWAARIPLTVVTMMNVLAVIPSQRSDRICFGQRFAVFQGGAYWWNVTDKPYRT